MKKKIYTKKNLFLLIISLPFFISCSKEDISKVELKTDNSGIHIVGYNLEGASYWKDGKGINLPSKNSASLNSVFISGNDAYVAGTSFENTLIATYWKNGVQHLLTDQNTRSEGNYVFVKDTNIYVTGVSNNNAVYWKNNRLFELQHKNGTSQYYSNSYSIFVKDTTVYTVGVSDYFDDGKGLPVYWINGEIHKLPGEDISGRANSVFVSDNGDVYIAGTTLNGPVYWKNGILHQLKDKNHKGRATSIFVKNNDVYIAGYDEKLRAKYWKNEVPVALYDSTKISIANSIFVKDSDVYVAGAVADDNYDKPRKGVYWKNGILVELTHDLSSGEAISIYIK